jgi:CHASE2 domain-containing sensor protein
MKWLEMAVLISAMATGILAFSKTSGTAQIYALILLPIALLMICYSVWTYLWRTAKIGARDAFRWDDPMGPIVITSLLIIALCTQFIQKVTQYMFI